MNNNLDMFSYEGNLFAGRELIKNDTYLIVFVIKDLNNHASWIFAPMWGSPPSLSLTGVTKIRPASKLCNILYGK